MCDRTKNNGYENCLNVSFQFVLVDEHSQEEVYKWVSDPFELMDKWRRVCYDLPAGRQLRVWFTSIRNETTTYGVDICVDDVRLNSYLCAGTFFITL